MNIHRALRTLFVAITAAGFLTACGGEETTEQLEPIVCGEGTRAYGDECIPNIQCGAGEVQLSDGRCIRGDYCGEDTRFDESRGRCVADTLRCGSDTIEEDGECLPDIIVTCGEGTVVSGSLCIPYDDICGEGTEEASSLECRPTEDVCGEGTVFDVTTRRCIRISTVSCGPGTIAVDGECLPSSLYFEELAESPDLDLRTASSGTIELKEDGEKFVFVGAIQAPEFDDGEPLENPDRYTFEGEAGQWLRLSLYSQGLPDPGFSLSNADEYHRFGDRGDGIEIHRDLLIPLDGSYELLVSSLPQLLGERQPNGGEDWNYVGFIEVMDPPEAKPLDLLGGAVSGNVKNPRENFYSVEGIDPGATIALLFNTQPLTADAQILLFDENGALETILPIESVVTFPAPGDSFHLLFDREFAYGALTTFSASTEAGLPLPSGDSITFDVSLEAGDYVGLFQFNLADQPITASVKEGSNVLVSTSSLASSRASSGERSLYWYSPQAANLTLEFENNSANDLSLVAPSYVTGSADHLDGISGEPVHFSYSESLPRDHRHYITLNVDFDELLIFQLAGTGSSSGLLSLFDDSLNALIEGTDSFSSVASPGDYLLAVKAFQDFPNGFNLFIEATDVFEVSESSGPNVSIPDNNTSGVSDTITIGSCPVVIGIDMDIYITHSWRGDLEIDLRAPNNIRRTLKARHGGSANDIIGNFNQNLNPETGINATTTAVPISDFEGASGSGSWTLRVRDLASGDTGILNSWRLNLLCEG